MQKKGPCKKITWILDECISPNKNEWEIKENEDVFSVSDLKLRGTKDHVISQELNKNFPNGFIIITKNIHEDHGDYFDFLPNQGIVRFGPTIQTKKEQQEVFRKFRKMFKNEKKILGAITSLGKNNITFNKGNRTKTVKYTNYI